MQDNEKFELVKSEKNEFGISYAWYEKQLFFVDYYAINDLVMGIFNKIPRQTVCNLIQQEIRNEK